MATEKVSGSQIVSKDLIVGGKSTVRNSAQFDRNVNIKGWLDAPNVKHAYKGLYQTADKLMTAHPNPQKGWYAAVADFEVVENPDEGTTTKTLEGEAILYVEYGGKWVGTNMSTTQLNDYVEQIETTLDGLEERTEALEEWKETAQTAIAAIEADIANKAWRDDVAYYGPTGSHNGVMSSGMAAQLSRLHRASAHISYFVTDSSEMTFMSGKPDSLVRAILYLEDKNTFVASTVDTDSPAEVYSEWDENEDDAFHASTLYIGSSGAPLQKLYFCGTTAYVYDVEKAKMKWLGDFRDYVSWEDFASENDHGIVKISPENGLTIKDGVLSLATATETMGGAMSASDKKKLDGLTIDVATEEKDGLMSKEDKTKLDELTTEVATEEEKGYMSACDKKKANMVNKLVLGGMITNGTMRFDTYCCTKRAKGEIDEETECTAWDGIIYFCDRKLFAAYVETDRLTDCGEAVAYFKFYTHWSGACLYMENVGVDGGIWKNKVYIHAGTTYQWKNCADDGKGQLLPSGDGVILSRPTEEQLQALVDMFQFVEPGEITGLASIDVVAAEPLVGKVTKDEQGNATLSLSITEVTEEEINEITGKED